MFNKSIVRLTRSIIHFTIIKTSILYFKSFSNLGILAVGSLF